NHFTLKARPIQASDLEEFVRLYQREHRAERMTSESSPRWRAFEHIEILSSETCRFDLQWEHEMSSASAGSVSNLDQIADEISADLQRALALIGRRSSGR